MSKDIDKTRPVMQDSFFEAPPKDTMVSQNHCRAALTSVKSSRQHTAPSRAYVGLAEVVC